MKDRDKFHKIREELGLEEVQFLLTPLDCVNLIEHLTKQLIAHPYIDGEERSICLLIEFKNELRPSATNVVKMAHEGYVMGIVCLKCHGGSHG